MFILYFFSIAPVKKKKRKKKISNNNLYDNINVSATEAWPLCHKWHM